MNTRLRLHIILVLSFYITSAFPMYKTDLQTNKEFSSQLVKDSKQILAITTNKTPSFASISVFISKLADNTRLFTSNMRKSPLALSSFMGKHKIISTIAIASGISLIAPITRKIIAQFSGTGCIRLAKHFPIIIKLGKLLGAKYDKLALHQALDSADMDIARALIQAKINIGEQNDRGMTPLHIAIEHDDPEIVQMLLKAGANPNIIDDEGYTPLYKAIIGKNPDIVQMLLLAGADKDTCCNLATPLCIAASHGLPETVKILSDAQANPDIKIQLRMCQLFDTEDDTIVQMAALHIAAAKGHLEVVQTLLASRANPDIQDSDGRTALHIAADRGDLEMVQALLASRANLDIQDSDGRTALHIAADRGDLEMVQALITAGANPSIKNKEGNTPLYDATIHKNLEMIIILLSAKCDPNIHNGEGLMSLHIAASLGYSDIVQTLLNYRANKNDADNIYHATPLFMAAYNGHLEAVQALLSVQANTDTQVTIPMKVLGGTDDDGTMQMTALHLAAEKNYLEIVQALLKAKIDFDAQASNGRTALHIAAHNGNLEIVQALTAAGADPNIKDQDGNTPLHHAVAKGHLQIAKELLRAGANPNIDNINHKTPLHFATQHGYFDMVQTLLIAGANPSAQNKQGKTARDIAFEFSHQEIFEYLNKVPQLITALKTALDRNSLDTIKSLILQGAPLVDEQGNYLLHEAIGTYIKEKPQKMDKKVRTLISAAGLVACGIRNKQGQTPLHVAAIQGNCWVAELLLRTGAYPNIADYRGDTPLHDAASIQMRNKLLSYGADAALVNKKGENSFFKHRDLWPVIFGQEQGPIGKLSEQDRQAHDQSILKPIL